MDLLPLSRMGCRLTTLFLYYRLGPQATTVYSRIARNGMQRKTVKLVPQLCASDNLFGWAEIEIAFADRIKYMIPVYTCLLS